MVVRPSRARVLVGAAAVLVVCAVLYNVCSRTSPNGVIRTAGTIEADETNLASKVAGRIVEICCEEGDHVEAGQVAVRLESSDLEAAVQQAAAQVDSAQHAVTVAESSIEYSKANLASAQQTVHASRADVDKAEAQLSEANRKTTRYRELYAHQVISQDALDDVVTASDAAAADYEAARSRLAATAAQETAATAQLASAETQRGLAVADLAQARAGLAYSQAKLSDTVITSPLSGTVVFKALSRGETVGPGVTILTIDDLDHLYARVDVDETLIDEIVLAGEATLRTQGGQALAGRVSRIGSYAEFATETDVTGGRQDIKTFKVRIAVDEPGGLLKPGMTVEVEIPKRSAP